MTKVEKFVNNIKKSLKSNYEACLQNKDVLVSLKKAKQGFMLILNHVYGNGSDYTGDIVGFKSLEVHIIPIPAKGRVVLTMPRLYNALDHYYSKYDQDRIVNPAANAIYLPEALLHDTKMIDSGKHQIPGGHKSLYIRTNCGKFSLAADDDVVILKPADGKQFNFGTEVALNYKAVANAISVLVDVASYYWCNIKHDAMQQEQMKYAIKGVED